MCVGVQVMLATYGELLFFFLTLLSGIWLVLGEQIWDPGGLGTVNLC